MRAFTVLQYAAWAVLFLITVWQLFRVFGGPITDAENPWTLVARSALFALLIGYAKPIFQLVLDIAPGLFHGGLKSIFRSWCRMVGSQLLLLVMNVWFLRGFSSATGQYIDGGGALSNGQGSVFLWLFCALAFLKTAQRFDSKFKGNSYVQDAVVIGGHAPGHRSGRRDGGQHRHGQYHVVQQRLF